MTTLKEEVAVLKQDQLSLRQSLNAVAAALDRYHTEHLQHKLEVHNELRDIRAWFTNSKPAAQQEETRTEPWRMALEDFITFRDSCKADWNENGNAKVAQRLARALKRTSGHAEGQLYINWCAKVGRAAVKAFWISRGFAEVPEGL